MAVIQNLRKNSWLLTLIIGLALLAFIVTGLDTSLFSSKQSNVVAEIDGVEYSYDEYNEVYTMFDEQLRSSGTEPSYAQKEQTYNNAWRTFIQEKLFEKCYSNLGLSVYKENLGIQGLCDDEITDITVGENIDPELQYYFKDPQTGQFSKEMLLNVLNNLSAARENNPEFYNSWVMFEKNLHQNTLRRKYVSLVSKGVFTTTIEAEDFANNRNEQFDIEYVKIPYESIADSTIAISDKEIVNHYKKINTEKRFQQTAGVSLEYVTFDIKPTEEDIKSIENLVASKAEDFQKAKDTRLFLNLNSDIKFDPSYNKKGDLTSALDSFAFASQIGDISSIYFADNSYRIAKVTDIRPRADSAKVRHILVNSENAYEVIDSLKTVIEKGGNFEVLARQYSIDSASAINGGIIDWFKEGQMVPSFQDSSFFGQVGKLYIAPSNYGVHLIEILAQGPKSKCVQVQVFSKEVTYSQNTRSAIYKTANKFASENRTKESFEATVENDPSLIMRTVNNADESQRVIYGVDDSRQVIRWAHQNKEIGKVSDIFRCGDKFLIAVITEINEEGASPISKIEESIKEDLLLEKKKAMILNDLKSFDCTSLDVIATAKSLTKMTSDNLSFALTTGPNVGVEPALFASASILEKDGITAPIAGERGVFVAKVTNKATGEVTDVEKEKTTQQQRAASTLSNNIYNILEKTSEITDNRINFN